MLDKKNPRFYPKIFVTYTVLLIRPIIIDHTTKDTTEPKEYSGMLSSTPLGEGKILPSIDQDTGIK